jgi:hypothetical protein
MSVLIMLKSWHLKSAAKGRVVWGFVGALRQDVEEKCSRLLRFVASISGSLPNGHIFSQKP